MNEEVKKILNDYEYDNRRVKKHYKLEKTPDWLEGVYAQQICRLFPKSPDNPDGYEPKPDEGRLLTDEECSLVELRMGESLNWCQPILKAQRDLTASIIRDECQERIIKKIEDSNELLELGRKAIEDVLVEWRDNRMSQFNRGNGLVIREKDGKDSHIIRFGPETALRIGLKAIRQALKKKELK